VQRHLQWTIAAFPPHQDDAHGQIHLHRGLGWRSAVSGAVDGVPVIGGATHGVGTQRGGVAEWCCGVGKATLPVGDRGTRPWEPNRVIDVGVEAPRHCLRGGGGGDPALGPWSAGGSGSSCPA